MKKKKKVLLVGASSMVGTYFKNSSSSKSFELIKTSRNRDLNSEVYLDLEDSDSIKEISFDGIEHAIIFSSITNQEKCNKDPELANKVNVEGTIHLLERLSKNNIHTIFPSTSLVHNGMNIKDIDNTQAEPIGIYGKNKYAVERTITDFFTKNTVILRITKIIDKDFRIFHQWHQALSNNDYIYPFKDLNFSPVSIDIVNQVIYSLLENRSLGVFNLSSYNQLNYAQAALYLAKKLNHEGGRIIPINAKEKVKDIHLPKYAYLDCNNLNDLGIIQPSSEESLIYFINNNEILKRNKN